ncbi:MAG: DUF4162 domain-containing protein [Acidimicrobiales bacterium]
MRPRTPFGSSATSTPATVAEPASASTSVVVIDHGRAIARGTADELKRRVGGDHLDVSVQGDGSVDVARRIMSALATGPMRVHAEEGEISAPVADGVEALSTVLRELEAAGVRIVDIGLRRPTLDDVFMDLTGHEATESAP